MMCRRLSARGLTLGVVLTVVSGCHQSDPFMNDAPRSTDFDRVDPPKVLLFESSDRDNEVVAADETEDAADDQANLPN